MLLAVELVDMCAGAERLLARVVQVFGSAQAHHGYLFADAGRTRMKRVAHEGRWLFTVLHDAGSRRPHKPLRSISLFDK